MAPALYLKECASTNDEIERFLPYNTPEIFAVYTFHQTKGKGQYGNSWDSPQNLNLAYSLAIPCENIKILPSLFNFHTAAVLREFVANLTKTKTEIKWPNDLIVKNKKISGILIEQKKINGTPYFIIGIGLNILQESFENLLKAGSLLTQTGIRFDPDEVANGLHEFLIKEIFEEISGIEILHQLNENLFRKDLVSVFDIAGARQNGIIKNVDEAGFLWVELEHSGLQKFYHKQLELLY